MPLISFAAGQRLTAARLNAALDVDRVAVQLSDQTVNNQTAFASSNDMVLSLAANSAYTLEACLIYDTTSSADFRLNLSVPAGAVVRQGIWRPPIPVAGSTTTIDVQATDTVTYGSGGLTGTWMTTRPAGIVATGGTAGNLTVQFAQEAATAVDTTLKTGSWIRLVKYL